MLNILKAHSNRFEALKAYWISSQVQALKAYSLLRYNVLSSSLKAKKEMNVSTPYHIPLTTFCLPVHIAEARVEVVLGPWLVSQVDKDEVMT